MIYVNLLFFNVIVLPFSCICGGGTHPNLSMAKPEEQQHQQEQHHRLLKTNWSVAVPLISGFVGVVFFILSYFVCFRRRHRRRGSQIQNVINERGNPIIERGNNTNNDNGDDFDDEGILPELFPEVDVSPNDEQLKKDRRALILKNIIRRVC